MNVVPIRRFGASGASVHQSPAMMFCFHHLVFNEIIYNVLIWIFKKYAQQIMGFLASSWELFTQLSKWACFFLTRHYF